MSWLVGYLERVYKEERNCGVSILCKFMLSLNHDMMYILYFVQLQTDAVIMQYIPHSHITLLSDIHPSIALQ